MCRTIVTLALDRFEVFAYCTSLVRLEKKKKWYLRN